MADLIYPAEVINNYDCDCNCGQQGVYWMPPPPPPEFAPPTDGEGCDCKRPMPPPWFYPWFPPFFPPPGPGCGCGGGYPGLPGGPGSGDPNDPNNPGGGNGGNGDNDDPNNPNNPGGNKPGNPNDPNNPGGNEPDVEDIEKQIQSLTKKLSVIKCMIEQIAIKKSDFIMKTDCCSYNFGNIDLTVKGWDDGSYAKTALRILYYEKELIQDKIRELASKLGDDDGDCGCGCNTCGSVESTVAGN